MKTFKKHLSDSLENEDFRNNYEEEKKLIELSLMVHNAREKMGLSQNEIAEKAHITQQQLSKVENGINCNMLTFLKICNALEIDFEFKSKRVMQ